VILPLKFPAVAGLKLTVTFCVDPAAIVPIQFPLKPAGYVMPVTLRGPVPVFRIESVRLAVWLTVRLPNEKFPESPMMRLWVAVPETGMVLFPAAEVMLRLLLWTWTLVGGNVTVALTDPPAGKVKLLPAKLYGNGLNATEKPVPMANERTWLSEA
jgi:hypothetical protein